LKRYVFKYLPESYKGEVIYRPIARVFISGSKNEWQAFRVYIDSGADMSLFRRGDAEVLGLSLNKGEYRPIASVGRMLIPAYVHAIKMRIGDTDLEVKAAFADSDEVPRLLGRKDIFPHFKVIFCEQDLEIIFETA
jgi:hypothetical protein